MKRGIQKRKQTHEGDSLSGREIIPEAVGYSLADLPALKGIGLRASSTRGPGAPPSLSFSSRSDSGARTPQEPSVMDGGVASSSLREQDGEDQRDRSFFRSFFFPASLFPSRDAKDRGEIESVHVLNREEGSSELLYEFDQAYESANPCFVFFLLSSVSPYIGAVAAAWMWKK